MLMVVDPNSIRPLQLDQLALRALSKRVTTRLELLNGVGRLANTVATCLPTINCHLGDGAISIKKRLIVHTTVIEDIREFLIIEDAFRGCDKSHFK